jgi:hypothetical protein
MTERAILIKELDELPAEYFDEVRYFVAQIKQRKSKRIPETMILSSSVLSKDWDTQEEDEVWASL